MGVVTQSQCRRIRADFAKKEGIRIRLSDGIVCVFVVRLPILKDAEDGKVSVWEKWNRKKGVNQ